MLFYHNSNQALDKLTPTIVRSRHPGEDPRTVNKAVIWLSNKPQLDNPPSKYRYVVEIDENSTSLFMDEPFDQLQKQFNEMFTISGNSWRWFFYFNELDILETNEYDAQQKGYKKINKQRRSE